MVIYTEKDWIRILKPYLELIDLKGGIATEMVIIKRMGMNRSRIHSHLLKAETMGYIERAEEIQGHQIGNNNIWKLTASGKKKC